LQPLIKPQEIFSAIKEIIRTRYSKKYFDKIDFNLNITLNDLCIKESSKEHKWKTLLFFLKKKIVSLS